MTPSASPIRPFVDYLVAHEGVPPRSGLAFDYILAADGLFVATENDLLAVRLPVAPCRLRGDRIAPVAAACDLRHGLLPRAVWDTCLSHAEAEAVEGREVAVLVAYRPDSDAGGRYRVIRPPQTVTATSAAYDEPDLLPGEAVLLSFHSHHGMGAYFSRTDDGDERQLRLYAVVGRLGTARPEVALRVGFNGHWLPLPWDSVFAGDCRAFRDAQFDSPDEGEAGDAAHDRNTPGIGVRPAHATRPRIRLTGLLALLASRRAARPGSGMAVLIDDDTREVLL